MSYHDLRALSQRRLDAFIEIGLGAEMWHVQKQIAKAMSQHRARVVVPSCNASGKTWLAARIALAFYWAFDDAKIITTSSIEGQLKDALWSEIRSAHASTRVPIPGELPPAAMWLRDGDQHWMKGTVARSREGFAGFHTGHKLIVADEASSVDEEAASGINALLASGDARLLLILNPTSDDSWAADQFHAKSTQGIRIRAWDTPNLAHLTNEEIRDRWGVDLEEERQPREIAMPEGADLTEPAWLDDMIDHGMGPGTPEWENRVEARFWTASDTQLISPAFVNMAKKVEPRIGRKVLGVDLAPYSTDENVIVFRRGNALVRVESLPAVRTDIFWRHVKRRVEEFEPELLIWDADGVGAGSYSDAERAVQNTNTTLFPFRGAASVGPNYTNVRSMWWWRLRQLFEQEDISLKLHSDDKLEDQLTDIRYSFTESGKIKIESKEKMHRRGMSSPDRADALMYAFSIDPPKPKRKKPHPNSERAMWARDLSRLERRKRNAGKVKDWNAVLDAPDW